MFFFTTIIVSILEIHSSSLGVTPHSKFREMRNFAAMLLFKKKEQNN